MVKGENGTKWHQKAVFEAKTESFKGHHSLVSPHLRFPRWYFASRDVSARAAGWANTRQERQRQRLRPGASPGRGGRLCHRRVGSSVAALAPSEHRPRAGALPSFSEHVCGAAHLLGVGSRSRPSAPSEYRPRAGALPSFSEHVCGAEGAGVCSPGSHDPGSTAPTHSRRPAGGAGGCPATSSERTMGHRDAEVAPTLRKAVCPRWERVPPRDG